MDPTAAGYGAGLLSATPLAADTDQGHRALVIQVRILELVARGAALDAVLTAVCGFIEAIDPTALTGVRVLSLDGQRFTHCVSTSLPAGFLQAAQDWPLTAPQLRSTCTVAVLQNEVITTLDIASDRRWSEQWRTLLLNHGIRAWLSYPIYGPMGAPLGSLFVAHAEPADDLARWDLDLIAMGARLAELALDREQASRELRELHQRLDVQADAQTERADRAHHDELRHQLDHQQRVEATLTQMQRLEALGQLTAGVAHDFNNLLTVVLGNLDYVERRADQWATHAAQFARRLSFARVAAEHGAKLIEQLLAFSRRQQLEPKVIELNEVIAGMRYLLQTTLSSSVGLDLALREDLWHALVDPTQLELVVLNLTINARDAMPAGGRLRVETRNVSTNEVDLHMNLPASDYVVVSVSDNGSGMSDDVLSHAFEPFFTTKDIGKGSGLGLAQVYGFARQSGGGVRIETQAGRGTTVHVYVPRALQSAHAEMPQVTHAADALAGKRILLVDDDPAVRQVTQAMLLELGCEVLEAGSGDAALQILRTDADIDLLLADFAMPSMNGAELAGIVRLERAQLPVLIITGYAEVDALRDIPTSALLRKPFRREQLADKVIAQLSTS